MILCIVLVNVVPSVALTQKIYTARWYMQNICPSQFLQTFQCLLFCCLAVKKINSLKFYV